MTGTETGPVTALNPGFTDAFGETLSIGDTITFQHKTAHTPYNRGAARYVKAVITGFTAKMLVVRWTGAQQLEGYANIDFKGAGTTGHWNPNICVLLKRSGNAPAAGEDGV